MSKKTSIKERIAHVKKKLGMDKQENEKLQMIEKEFEERTSQVDYDWDLGDFFMLLNLAEYGYLGKTHAIIFALKIGYQQGHEDLRVKTLKWAEETLGITEMEGD